MGKIITGYKGFNRDFTCRGFQYEVGKTYEIEGKPELCERGFHFCTSPLAVFRFYEPKYRFAIVQADEDDVVYDTDNNFHKAVARRITIVSEISLQDIIELQKKYTSGKEPSIESDETCILGGEGMAFTKRTLCAYSNNSLVGVNAMSDCYVDNIGVSSVVAAADTERAVAASNGICSAAVVTGYSSMANSYGFYSIAVATDRDSAAISSKEGSAAVATYYDSAAIGSNGSTAMCTGFDSVAMATDAGSLAVAAGQECSASGVYGSWLVLVQRDTNFIFDVQAVRVDNKAIKEGVRYKLEGGKICEVCE